MFIKFKKVVFKNAFVFVLLFACTHPVVAQLKLPSIDYLPQSPAAASFARYGEIPVGHSTGVANIEIPIHTVKVGDVQFPISLTYHSSGIKVRDVASEVGLGFVLNTGGVVTTQIIGKPDVDNLWPTGPYSYRSANDIQNMVSTAHNSGNSSVIQLMAEHFFKSLNPYADYHPIIDSYSDRFSYSLCTGESGVFRKEFSNSNTMRVIPYKPVKIDLDYPDVTITGANGYKHYFTSATSSKDYYVLNKIVSADNTDEIQYYYRYNTYHQLNVNFSIGWQWDECYIEYDPMVCGFYVGCLEKRPWPQNAVAMEGGMDASTAPLLDSLVTRNETIFFEYIKDRYDDVLGTLSYPSYYRLQKISVIDKVTRQVVKSYNLSHSYFGNVTDKNRRLRLDSLKVAGKTTDVVEVYAFKYDTTILLPSYPQVNGLNVSPVYFEDYWGYFNGSANSNLFPSFVSSFGIPQSQVQYANLEPAWPYTKACMLTEINYPTGGRTTFEYEANTASGYSVTTQGGGVRIKKISSNTFPGSDPIVKSYEYSNPTFKSISPSHYTWTSPEYHFICNRRPNSIIFDQDGFELYKAFSTPFRPFTYSGLAVVYGSVTEYVGTPTSNNGKIVYVYSPPEDADARYEVPGNIDLRYISYFHNDCGNYTPRLLSSTAYKNDGVSYEIVRSEENSYQKFHQNEFNTGVSLSSNVVVHYWGAADMYNGIAAFDDDFTPYHEYLLSLIHVDTKAFEEVDLITTHIVKEYSGASTYVQTTTTYEYDSDYTQVSSQTTGTSTGSTLVTQFKYPYNFSFETPYNTMVSRNILTPIVEQIISKDAVQLQAVKTNFDYWTGSAWSGSATDIIVPRTVQEKKYNNNYETRLRYHTYNDKASIVSLSKEDDVQKVYLWGYNNTFPVAEVINASESDVAYTSFEGQFSGGWNGVDNSHIQPDANCVTGKNQLDQIGFNISKSGLSSPGEYIVSYWSKSGSFNVNSTLAIGGRSIGPWRHWQHKVVNPVGGTISLSGSGTIDELRLYPTNAQMVTFTFEPHFGMTTQCDVNNRIVYYEYDDFGRLKLIRDQDKNILKTYDYKYQADANQ